MGDTILIVEDEGAFRENLAEYIEDTTDYAVLQASNGMKGLEMYRSNNPDCILSDNSMPRMGGVEMFYRIREVDSDIPLLLMTSSDVGKIRQDVKIDVTDFIQKPVILKEVVEMIDRVVGR
tara:strand:- start:739 stop:1101 length:363 start_codon:yes stop_codon:yes gene_type:complete